MSIEEICEKYDIGDYIINDDGSIDVNECVYLDNYGLNEFPLKFNKVQGDFDCRGNNLTRDSNLFKSPYFSLIGNLGNSNLSLLKSITPECCPKAYLNFNLIYFFCSKLYSPKG